VKNRLAVLWHVLFAIFLLASCASPISTRSQNDAKNNYWHGRLSVRVAADPATARTQSQSLVSEFELEGTPEQGQLTLFSPIGSTAARIDWTAHSALLLAQGKQQSYTSIAILLSDLTGADLPVSAFFAWLKGQAEQAPGWQIDLSQFAFGKISAKRDFPQPQTEIRVMLEQ